MEMDIICSGFGGQGVLTAGMLLINAGMKRGQYVTWSPSYGSEMRGGTANSNVIISDEEIGSPYCVTLDMLIAMNEPSVDKFIDMLLPGGLLILNSSIISGRDYPQNINVFEVPANEIASSLGNPRGVNMVMLGAAIKASGLFDIDFFASTVDEYFLKKGKSYPKNIECLYAGFGA